MNRLSTEQYPQSFFEALNRVQAGESVIIARDGEDLAAMIPLALWERWLETEENRLDAVEAKRIMNDSSDEVVSWETAKRELDIH